MTKKLNCTCKDDKKELAKLKEELKVAKQYIKQLKSIISEKETKKVVKKENRTVEDYGTNDFCTLFQTFFKEATGQGLFIASWPTACSSMKNVMQAFHGEKQTNYDIVSFLRWAAARKTHNGKYMNIGYLPYIIQDYRMQNKPHHIYCYPDDGTIDNAEGLHRFNEIMGRRLK